MTFHSEGIGGSIFLALYTGNLGVLAYGYITGRIIFKSVFTFLLIHVLLRLAAQCVEIALATKDSIDVGLLIAWFVLSAEGYFSLVLVTYRFLIHHHQHTYPISGSWLEGKPVKRSANGKDAPILKRLVRALTARDSKGRKDPWVMTVFHWWMIGANVVIINGGTRTNTSDYGSENYEKRLNEAKILRTVGQAIFLVINILLGGFLLLTRKQDLNPAGTIPPRLAKYLRVPVEHGEVDVLKDRRRLDGYGTRMHPMLRILWFSWPPLIVRGVFGLLQGLIPKINYANIAAYNANGFTRTFVIAENVVAVLPEWTACCLLCLTMFTRESFNPKHESFGHLDPEEEEERDDATTVGGSSGDGQKMGRLHSGEIGTAAGDGRMNRKSSDP